MDYLRVPKEVTIAEIRARGASLSPGMHRRVIIPSSTVKRVRDLLNPGRPFDRGIEPGSLWYMKYSPRHLIRTKALQDHSCLLYPKGDAIVPVNPKVFEDPALCGGDILMAKDSNVGECAIIDGDHWKNCMFSGGIVRLHPICDGYYFFAFLKHSLFKTQLLAMTARGATITHAKTLWLDCLIPTPNQDASDGVIHYVSALMQAIVEKQKAMRERSDSIHNAIQLELEGNQKKREFQFEHPHTSELTRLGRLDAAIYDRQYKSRIWLVENYAGGYTTPKADGFVVTPGPSLETKILGTRLDSEVCRPGFYALILPTNISEYGTMNAIPYIGTGKRLPLLRKGDIVFGEAGFQKGRSIALLDGIDNCTTNAHGLYARRADGDIQRSIVFRCVFNWYRSMGLIDLMGVGGSGGHFSPEYFDYVRIPKFPAEKQAEIARLYSNPVPPPPDTPTPDGFVDWHRRWDANLGIWELDREMKALQRTLADVQETVIEGKTVQVPI
jgi:hypothetical protein